MPNQTEAFWTISDSDLQRLVEAAVRASDRRAAQLVHAHTLRVSLFAALILFFVGIASFGAGAAFRGTACVAQTSIPSTVAGQTK